jgi:glycosyltransferase involved in cell wall biosynthesis
MTERTTVPITEASTPAPPLVLHIIPTTLARGAQLEARALADQLDRPGFRLHRVLSLFEGPPEVAADYSLGHRARGTAGVGFALRLVSRLRSTLGRLDPAVVVAHGSEPLKYAVPAMVGRHRPLLYYAIGTYSGADRWIQLQLWRRLTAKTDAVAAEGEEVLDECVTRFGVPPPRVTLAPNGRDPEVFHPPSERPMSDPPLVLFVGALTTGKRPDRFIEVVARLRADGTQLRAELVGDGPLREVVAGPAEAAGVELLGSRTDVAEQMRRADVVVFCSRPAGEGMPGVLIEAGMSGLPVVATSVPGVTSIVGDGETGFVVPVDDVSAMVTATTRLVADPELRRRMGEAARARCTEHFSLAAVASRWLAILQPLIDAGRDRRPSR